MTLNLLIDTSSDYLILALASHGVVYAQHIERHESNLSLKLLPAIDALLKNSNTLKKNLSHITLGIGPGSYTGTRIGASVAKALCFALNIPLISLVSTLFFMTPSKKLAGVISSKTPAFFLTTCDLTQERINFSPALNLEEFKEKLTAFSPDTLWVQENSNLPFPQKQLFPDPALAAQVATFCQDGASSTLLYFQEIA